MYGRDYCGPRGVPPYLEAGQRHLTSCSYLAGRTPPPFTGFCFGYEKGCKPHKRLGYPTYGPTVLPSALILRAACCVLRAACCVLPAAVVHRRAPAGRIARTMSTVVCALCGV